MAREQRWTSDSQEAKAREERALATERDRIVRNNSVANDIRLNLPVSVQMPDGEEHFSKPSPRLLPYDTRSEIQRPYIKPPPNKTVCCTPDWDDSIGPSPCSCGPVSQSVPKCSSSGQQSGWSLSWSRSSKSPPSHSHSHRCQRHSHQHPSNPSSNRHAAANSSSSKQKSSSSQHSTVVGFLIGVGGSSSADKSHNTVQFKGPPSAPSITERLHSSLTEKVHCITAAGLQNTRTSLNNNSSMSGVLARLVDEPLFSTNSSRDNKRNGKCKKSPRNEPSGSRTVSPSETHLAAGGHLSNVIEDVRYGLDNTRRTLVPLPFCPSGMTRLAENIPISSCALVYIQDKSSGSEDGDSSDEKTIRNDDNGNARVPPVIGQQGDNFLGERNEQHCSFEGGGLHASFSTTEGRGSYSKNVSSTTDSSLYHLNMHPRLGSALSESESIKETAHSELSETYTANQLSDQYSAEIASTSSICSSGQSKDVRSLRDVT